MPCEEQSMEKPLPPVHCCNEGYTAPSKICVSCNINLAPSGQGVIITCHNCTDLDVQVKLRTLFYK